MLSPGKTYAEMYRSCRWNIPDFFNIGVDICDKWAADPSRLALIYENETGKVENYTFKIIKEYSDKLANTFTALGLGIGDRVAILLLQRPETAIAHIAAYKVGAIAIPLFTLFGTDALSYRLSNSGAKIIITDKANLEKIEAIRSDLPQLDYVLVTDLDKFSDNILSFRWVIEKTAPGHRVGIIDEEGKPLPPGVIGQIAVKSPDPVMFLQYWQNPEATRDKFLGEWLLTGDLAKMDEDGYFWFQGRADDIIISSGYRIGPAEIEECLMKHPAVAMVAVVGSPDKERTEVVKAFIIPKPGTNLGPELETDIKNFVKVRLAAHEYPRKIEFVNELPMTTTGKIMRRELKQREIERSRS